MKHAHYVFNLDDWQLYRPRKSWKNNDEINSDTLIQIERPKRSFKYDDRVEVMGSVSTNGKYLAQYLFIEKQR